MELRRRIGLLDKLATRVTTLGARWGRQPRRDKDLPPRWSAEAKRHTKPLLKRPEDQRPHTSRPNGKTHDGRARDHASALN